MEFKKAEEVEIVKVGARHKIEKFVNFGGVLTALVPVVIDFDNGKFKKEDGSPAVQTITTVVILEEHSFRDLETSELRKYKPGDMLTCYIGWAYVVKVMKEQGNVIGRLGKDGKAYVMRPPTEEDFNQAKKILATVDFEKDTYESEETPEPKVASNANPWD